MGWQRDFIEKKRREKFYSDQAIAEDFHESLMTMSVELYQNDMHFVKEIIQNAEDNTYAKDVRPSLEFVLTNEDVAEMCVPATLLILNNESGLKPADVDALCSVRKSTKKGKRDKGLIGCKGIGFKSVFMVSKTPIIISNGFRICFSDEPSEAGFGYIVPEWIESPTNKAIRAACGCDTLPNTVIILPLRVDKVDLVRGQLKEISPENILFLSKIKELHVVNKVKNESARTACQKIIRSEPIVSIGNQLPVRISNVETKVTFKLFKVHLTVECDRAEASDTFSYVLFHGLFPVTHPIKEREEVRDWAISLAFPEEGRASSNAGDVFSFLPTELRTGFPFIVNADFLLTSSRETIKFDSQWNVGILDCIPSAFSIAFSKMISPSKTKFLSDRRDVYKFLPVNGVDSSAYRFSQAGSSENRQVRQKLHVEPQQTSNIHQLEKVRNQILQKMGKHKYIFLSSPGIQSGLQLSKEYDLPAKSCLLIKESFRSILEISARCNHPAPSAVLERARTHPDGLTSSGSEFGIIEAYVQERYAPALKALGVCEMTKAQYKSFLLDSEWLYKLPDKIYIRVLSFVAFESELHDEMDKVDLLKIRGHQKLTSFANAGESEVFYTSSLENAEWIYAWVREFSSWDSVEVLPANTSQALIEACNHEDLITWIKKRVSLTEMSVRKYAERLIEKLTGADAKTRNKKDSKFSILVLQFLYNGIYAKKLSREFVIHSIESVRNMVVFDGKSSRERNASLRAREEGGILLPSMVSKWPTLFTFSRSDPKYLITLSDRYMEPQCSLVENIVTKSPGPDSMLEFIKEAFNAVDLPSINLPFGEHVTFRYPVTKVESILMLEWLKVFLPSRKAWSLGGDENDHFLRSVKEFAWVKTYQHKWQRPTSVFFSIDFFQDRFTAHDLPFLDVPSYSHLSLDDDQTRLVFEKLSLVTDVTERKGCDAIVKYFSTCSAKDLDLEAVSRFYTYLDEVALPCQIEIVKVWIPPDVTSKVSKWKDPTLCIISDELGIFADSRSVTVLDKIYDGSLVPKFFNKLQVPEKASGDLHCRIWLEWSCLSTALDKVKDKDDCPRNAAFVSRFKVEHVLAQILDNWHDSSRTDSEPYLSSDCDNRASKNDSSDDSEPDSSNDCDNREKTKASKNDSSDDNSNADSIKVSARVDCSSASFLHCMTPPKHLEEEGEISREVWESFHSFAWVPVAPVVNELVSGANETISIVPPSQVLIANDLELSKSFSEAANGMLNFVWLPPNLSIEQLAKLKRMYLKIGVRDLSQLITYDVGIPQDVVKTIVPRGKGLICEGLFRILLGFLCKNKKKHGLSLEGRLGALSPLISATEVNVGEPFENILRIYVETLTSPATIKKSVFVHYDSVNRKLYCLRRDHALLKATIRNKLFNSQFATAISVEILSNEHPKLVQGLIDLLRPLCGSKFSTKSVQSVFHKENLLIFPEDEKLLMKSMARFAD